MFYSPTDRAEEHRCHTDCIYQKTRDSALFLEHEICSRPTDRREVMTRQSPTDQRAVMTTEQRKLALIVIR